MSDYNAPSLSSLYTDFLAELKLRDVSAITLCLADPTNTPTGAIKWNRAADKFQEWDGAAWQDQPLSIAGGGTGSTSASAARSALGLGTMSTQNSNAVAITGGSIGSATSIDAASIVSGTVAVARLGTGSGGSQGGPGYRVLHDNGTWYEAVPIGTVAMWAGAFGTTPTGWISCSGAAISRAGFATLFSIIGTTYGVGDGSTTFNIPNTFSRMPFGVGFNGTSGLNVTLGQVYDTYTHAHNVNSHTHGISGVYPHAHTASGTVSITDPGHVHTYYTFFDAAIGSDYPAGAIAGQYGAQSTVGAVTGITATTAITVDSAGGTTSTDGAGGTTDSQLHLPPFIGFNFMIKAY